MIVKWKGCRVEVRAQWFDDPTDLAVFVLAVREGSPVPINIHVGEGSWLPWNRKCEARARTLLCV